MNVAAVRASALAVAEYVRRRSSAGCCRWCVGGDCTIELGHGARLAAAARRTPLIYFDPHPDLNTPPTVPDGALDWMGMAHLLGLPGARELTDLGRRHLAQPTTCSCSGTRRALHRRRARHRSHEPRITAIAQSEVARDPAEPPRRAFEWAACAPFLLHFDTDSIDFADLPLAENTDRNVGLSFAHGGAPLSRLLCEGELGA